MAERRRLKAIAWRSTDVTVTLPMATVRRMWRKVRVWASEGNSRLQSGATDTVEVWSAAPAVPGATITGLFLVRWDSPLPGMATISRIAWDPARGGSEAEVWQVMELLAGRPLR